MKESHEFNPKTCFLRRTTDGKYYRGAKLWKWTKSWRRAALLTPSFVRFYLVDDEIDWSITEIIRTELPKD